MNTGIPEYMKPQKPADTLAQSRTWLIAASIVALLFWYVPYLKELTLPIRFFVTYIHETGHAVSAYLTGGSAYDMKILPDGSGSVMTATAPYFRLVTSSAGYLGSTLFGALLLMFSQRPQWARNALFGLFGLILFAAIFWVTPFNSFGFFVGLGIAALLFGAGYFLRGIPAAFLVQFLAVQCCLNALSDILILLQINVAGSQHNDAASIAASTGIPAVVWAFLWGAMSIVILWLTLKVLWRSHRETRTAI